MTTKLKSACLGLALAAGCCLPAAAADWNNGAGSFKDNRGAAAVPVPAPMPIPIFKPEWYFRLDAGISISGDDGDGSESGLTYGRLDSPGTTGPTPFGTRPAWLNNDFDTMTSYGAGVGFRWNDRVRTDLTIEGRSQGDLVIDGTERYVLHEDDGSGNYGPRVDGSGNPTTQVNVYTRDVTKMRSVFTLANAYYDFNGLGGFTPYVGGGIGLAFHELNRRHNTTETTCDLTTTPSCNTEFTRGLYGTAEKQHTFTLAAALTAGFSYAITDITALDFNYRYLYIEGPDMKVNVTDHNNVTSTSRVTLGDTHEHQLRAGLRFNVN